MNYEILFYVLAILFAYVIYTGVGIAWFLHRMGDKFGDDKRWWVFILDGLLIAPLLPLAAIIGKIRKV